MTITRSMPPVVPPDPPDEGDEQSAFLPEGSVPIDKIWEEDAAVIVDTD